VPCSIPPLRLPTVSPASLGRCSPRCCSATVNPGQPRSNPGPHPTLPRLPERRAFRLRGQSRIARPGRPRKPQDSAEEPGQSNGSGDCRKGVAPAQNLSPRANPHRLVSRALPRDHHFRALHQIIGFAPHHAAKATLIAQGRIPTSRALMTVLLSPQRTFTLLTMSPAGASAQD
jgi:hypothetical protein